MIDVDMTIWKETWVWHSVNNPFEKSTQGFFKGEFFFFFLAIFLHCTPLGQEVCSQAKNIPPAPTQYLN